MNATEISKGIYYVGVNDRTTSLFEGLWSLPIGVSYNSYIVKGEKIALIDTVHATRGSRLISQLKEIIGDAPIDYLVINHMEPDHSGSIELIRQYYPNVQIIGNSKTAGMIEGYYGITDNIMTINNGDELDLGDGKNLKFVLTPMVHWPETMMTLETSSSTLFSGDAFGSFGALNGGIVDTEMDVEIYINEMYRYYSNIVAKYSVFVQKALAKLAGVKLEYICSTHGPVWHKYIDKVVSIYTDLSNWKSEEGVVIAYGSMYGNTEELVDVIARQLILEGVKNIRIYNLSNSNLSYVLSDICKYKGVIIGGPTYSNSVYPPVEALLSALELREIKNKVFTSFGSYTWAPGILKKVAAYTDKLDITTLPSPVEMKQAISPCINEQAKLLAKSFAEALKKAE